MRIRLKHQTEYIYDNPAALGPHIIRLCPAGHAKAAMLSYNLTVAPQCELRWQHDPWSNRIARATFPADALAERLTVTVDAFIDVRPYNPFDFFVDDRCAELPFQYPDGLRSELEPFLKHTMPGPRLLRWLERVPFRGNTVNFLVRLNQQVAKDIRYIIRNETGIQTAEETLERGSGSCRDSAVLIAGACRAHGLAARFVSGYLVQLADEGIIPDEAKGVLRDVVDLHAWAEVYIPGGGWIGLDGTSGLLCSEGHIPLACTVNPELAAPISGTASQPATDFLFVMNVARTGHEPRPRAPYEEPQWEALKAQGGLVDKALEASGVRLTMGGEPTWTSRLHPALPEWNTAALGATKFAQGVCLASELRARFGTGPLVMERMGKQYPGESLPRWIFDILWRRDGVPVWRDPRLLAFAAEAQNPKDLDAQLDDAEVLGEAIARALGIENHPLVPGYEDPWHFIIQEQNLPLDVDPLQANLDDSEDRRRLARILERGLERVTGYALPLARRLGRWQTAAWTFRRGHMFLVPGDSPMGLRLPLDRIGGEPAGVHAADTTHVTGEAIAFDPHQLRVYVEPAFGEGLEPASLVPQTLGTAGTTHTALCVEPRGGALYVFLPPMASLEDFLQLTAAVEDAAAATGLTVRIEGYPPPPDPRMRNCLVTPDPGVIEVNVPVTETFGEYVNMLEHLSEAANHAGLCTEKYQLDGRECGSGGGHHLTLGGPSTVQSPFLKRPDLLASWIRYTQNHPALSYLFSGLFVGPTSQAPRLDEARHDSLYEMEIALERLASTGESQFPWFTDRVLRNLLVDLTGNTHRAEICIDKLYSPSGAHGRQGIVEFRAFEMPPHERMAAAQMLLVRALTAWFLREPYERRLVRWGSELHDRFMLPHFLWLDMRDVLDDLRRAGFPFDDAWYVPFLDYRFPIMGRVQLENIGVEVRMALEPWHVLGEEPTGAATSRYVDSSLERLQIKADGLTGDRHVVTVNGHVLPLRPTGRASEWVAGVRFRAWQPPHCLQPHIGVHHPLRFDVVDTWAKQALGACTYHVWHPDGRAYDQPPLTTFEAAARRAQRFTTAGHAPWPVAPSFTAPHGEQPYSLDMRRLPGFGARR